MPDNNITQAQDLSPQMQSFNQKFGETAFSIFRSKYPQLQNHLVTFKVIDSDIDTGFAMGAFIVQKGADVVYVPIVLAEGTVASCEMVYSKVEDTLYPLIKGEVDRILSTNSVGEPTVAKKAPMVESTKSIFRGMFRPPSRSNIVLASNSSVLESLPNKAKLALSKHLESNPDLLAKVAEFYPVEVLARKLVPTQSKVAAQDGGDTMKLPELIKLAEVTSEVSQLLSSDQKSDLLKTGYLITTRPSGEPTRALSTSKLATETTTKLQLTEKDDSNPMYGTAYLLMLQGAEIVPVKCAVIGNTILTENGTVRTSYGDKNCVVLSEFKDGVWASDLIALGVVKPEEIKGVTRTPSQDNSSSVEGDGYYDSLQVFYPTKSGNFKTYRDREVSHQGKGGYPCNVECPSDSTVRRGDLISQNIEGDIYLKNGDPYGTKNSIGFVKHLNNGFLQVNPKCVVFPKTALVTFVKENSQRFIESISSLQSFLLKTSPKLRLIDNGAGLSLNDSSTKKTASFKDAAEVAHYVATRYAMDKVATEKLFSEREVILFRKQAFVPESNMDPYQTAETPANSFGTTGYMSQPGQGALEEDFNVDHQMMNASAGLGDEDMFDTGMLASLSGNKDIKELLVDMIPSFSDTLTQLGRTILSFAVNKKEMEEYYGREQYSTLLGNVRKVFRH
jgi:hypothetical protein